MKILLPNERPMSEKPEEGRRCFFRIGNAVSIGRWRDDGEDHMNLVDGTKIQPPADSGWAYVDEAMALYETLLGLWASVLKRDEGKL